VRCFARWEKDDIDGVFFRDQTILQFGDSWDFLASFILLNPGSALPLNEEDQTKLLRSKKLPFFVEPNGKEKYVEFTIDRLMNDVLNLFNKRYSGGTIRLYNLFNLKNQHSGEALEQFKSNQTHHKMFATDAEIKFCKAPVIVASGGNAKDNMRLKQELVRYISFVKTGKLYKVAKSGEKQYSIIKTEPDRSGFIDSYHPSYTFKYGNSTHLGELKNQ
jgi:hypothetical protein